MIGLMQDIFNAWNSPVQFEYMSLPAALLLFVLLAAPILWLGLPALRWQGTARQTISIGSRLALLWILVMILSGVRWLRTSHDLDVIVLRDVSTSTVAAVHPPGTSVQSQITNFLRGASDEQSAKPVNDRIGVVRFDADALLESLPQTSFRTDVRPISSSVSSSGTDIAAAIRLGLACFGGDAMKRLVLVSDGNPTQGDLSAALAAASSARVPIDVIPLNYDLDHEIAVERIVAPPSLRQGEPFGIEVVIRSTSALQVTGKLGVTVQSQPIDLDPDVPGTQPSMPVTLKPGANLVRLKMPPIFDSGLNEYRAVFTPDSPDFDSLVGNNVADTFTFVRGKGKVLYVDHFPVGQGDRLAAALASADVGVQTVERINVDQFPSRLIDLESYDAVILANVPRGPGGLNDEQDRILTSYVNDMAGGLVVIGGPEALGAGNWQNSRLEKILPVDLDVQAERVMPAGALVLVLDRSGSMRGPMPKDANVNKQDVANESAVLALRTLTNHDWVGVIAFDAVPRWVVDLAENRDPLWAAGKIRSINPDGGTSIGPALERAVEALEQVPADRAGVKRIVLLTDGHSLPFDYTRILERISAAHIVLSTVAVGSDADGPLLEMLAQQGKGQAYTADDPHVLKQIFIKEARTLRRSLIHEPAGGIGVSAEPGASGPLKSLNSFSHLDGMVLTSRKTSPFAQVLLSADNKYHDPILATGNAGIGNVAVFTGDATARWASDWINSPAYAAFWTQVVRSVSRSPLSSDFEVSMVQDGLRTRLIIEAAGEHGDALGGYSFIGRVAGNGVGENASRPVDLRPVQTGPGRYEATFDTPQSGNLVALVQFKSPAGKSGTLLAGTSVNASPEFRQLRSNVPLLNEIAARTGGRILSEMDRTSAIRLFQREGLPPTVSTLPLWDMLIPLAALALLVDVAVRRIIWEEFTPRRMMALLLGIGPAAATRDRNTAAQSVARLGALKLTKERVEKQLAEPTTEPLPDPRNKFESQGVEGEISQIVGGAIDKPVPPPPKKIEPKGVYTGNLLEAKRRARRQIEDGEGKN